VPQMNEVALRFMCDRMLGSLCKWLRFLGFDTLYPPDVNDIMIDQLALNKSRILLTRDRSFLKNARSPKLLIRSLQRDEQIREVDREFNILSISIERKLVLSRCSVCNQSLDEVTKDEINGKVPPGVYEHQHSYWFCPECEKYYWPGTHYMEILNKIETLK